MQQKIIRPPSHPLTLHDLRYLKDLEVVFYLKSVMLRMNSHHLYRHGTLIHLYGKFFGTACACGRKFRPRRDLPYLAPTTGTIYVIKCLPLRTRRRGRLRSGLRSGRRNDLQIALLKALRRLKDFDANCTHARPSMMLFKMPIPYFSCRTILPTGGSFDF